MSSALLLVVSFVSAFESLFLLGFVCAPFVRTMWQIRGDLCNDVMLFWWQVGRHDRRTGIPVASQLFAGNYIGCRTRFRSHILSLLKDICNVVMLAGLLWLRWSSFWIGILEARSIAFCKVAGANMVVPVGVRTWNASDYSVQFFFPAVCVRMSDPPEVTSSVPEPAGDVLPSVCFHSVVFCLRRACACALLEAIERLSVNRETVYRVVAVKDFRLHLLVPEGVSLVTSFFVFQVL